MTPRASFLFSTILLLFQIEICVADYSKNMDAKKFTEIMISKHKFEEEEIVNSLKSARKQDAIIKAMSKPAEKVKPWHAYRNIFITKSRIEKGVKFWKENIVVLENAHEEFGINPEIIVSIIGIETNYGKNMGSFRVIDALSTLAFDYYTKYEDRESRRLFFTHQLENLFLLAREQKIDPLSLKGSYAGAMGFGQFMPDSYRNYAVDFDNDTMADIWKNPTDAIGSVANYLMRHGWEKDEIIVAKAKLTEKRAHEIIYNKISRPKKSIGNFTELGLEPLNLDTKPGLKALPIKLDNETGDEYWFGFQNFHVIGRYNPRVKYAMAVTQLSYLVKDRFCEVHLC